MNVDIWSDLACPWCFIGTERFGDALGEFDGRDEVRVIWHSFQLDPSIPQQFDGSEVDYLVQSKDMSRDDVVRMTQTVADTAAGDGIRIDFDKVRPANSRLAHHLVHLAQLRGVGAEVTHDLFVAHFTDGADLGDHTVLRRIGEAHGLDTAEISEALGSDAYDAAMRSDAAQANGIGIQGVPFFIVDARYAISGAQPKETFVEALRLAAGDRAGGSGGMCGGGGCGGNCGCG